MKSRHLKIALAAMLLIAATEARAGADDDTAAEIRALKARLRQLEEKVAKQDRERKETTAKLRQAAAAAPPASVCKDTLCPPSPAPVFISFKNGLKVESWDHDFSFKIGGYIFVDGGVSTQPETGKAGTVNLSRARLQVEGKAFSYWLYKLQYEFAGNTSTGTVGGSSTVAGGIRDAYLALKYPGLAVVPFASEPLVLQLGNFYEPMGLERTNSLLYTDFIYRAMPSDALTPSRHIGLAALAHGGNWSAKAGIFSTSPEDRALAPPPGTPAFPFPASAVATGGGQYFDLTGRTTYAPIMEKDALLHFGVSARFHRPNDSTGANDNRVMLLGSNVQTEAPVLGENLLGTPRPLMRNYFR